MVLELITIYFDFVTQFSYEIWGYAKPAVHKATVETTNP